MKHAASITEMEMEEICSSETSVDFRWTTRSYTPEDATVKRLCDIAMHETTTRLPFPLLIFIHISKDFSIFSSLNQV
jgi:lipopolysaccharide/colanic/teichoic acid biosynthesis glycosyltransferase